jgi:hypothetical protein
MVGNIFPKTHPKATPQTQNIISLKCYVKGASNAPTRLNEYNEKRTRIFTDQF